MAEVVETDRFIRCAAAHARPDGVAEPVAGEVPVGVCTPPGAAGIVFPGRAAVGPVGREHVPADNRSDTGRGSSRSGCRAGRSGRGRSVRYARSARSLPLFRVRGWLAEVRPVLASRRAGTASRRGPVCGSRCGRVSGRPGGISPPGSHGTERDSLPSFRSSHPSVRTRSSSSQWANSPGSRSMSSGPPSRGLV